MKQPQRSPRIVLQSSWRWLVFGIVFVACGSVIGNAEAEKPIQRVQTEILRLFPWGFELKEISRPAGTFFLAINNRTGIQDLVLYLSAQSGKRLKEVKYKKTSFRWHALLDLNPGSYVVTVEGHPEWVCTINIKPKKP